MTEGTTEGISIKCLPEALNHGINIGISALLVKENTLKENYLICCKFIILFVIKLFAIFFYHTSHHRKWKNQVTDFMRKRNTVKIEVFSIWGWIDVLSCIDSNNNKIISY